MSDYIGNEYPTAPIRAIAAGKTGEPEVLTHGGVKSVGKIVYTGNHVRGDTTTINGVVFTCGDDAYAVGKIVYTGNHIRGDITTINGVAFTARDAAPAVGKIVYTGNHVRGDTSTFNGVVFTARDAAPAVGKIVFTGNILADDTITMNGVVFTAKAAGAAGELEFDVGANLSDSLDAFITKLNACTDVLVSYATYSKTDTSTAVTSTSDADGTAGNGKVFSSTHVSVVVTEPVGGFNAATGETEYDVDATLTLSLDALITKLNASTDVLVSYATYSKTDTNTAVTSTSDSVGTAGNGKVFSSTHATVVVTNTAGGFNAATGETEYDVNVSLTLSLDALITKLNASTNVLVSYATYSKTDTNTAVTSTADAAGSASNGLVLSSTHDSAVVTAPTGGFAAASGELEYEVGGSLSASIDSLVTKLNACTDVAVSYATYTKTDTNTAVTSTSDGYAEADNDKVLASTHSTVVITQPTGGKDKPTLSLDTENHKITQASGTEYYTLSDGHHFQRQTIWMDGAGTAILLGNLTGSNAQVTLTEGQYATILYLDNEWKTVTVTGTLA